MNAKVYFQLKSLMFAFKIEEKDYYKLFSTIVYFMAERSSMNL